MKHLLASALLSIICFAAHAEWSPLITGVGNKSSMDVDRSTFKRNGDIVKLWTRWDFDTDEYFGGNKYRSNVSLVEINCKEDMARTLYARLYSGQKGEGKQVGLINQPDVEFHPIPPQTMLRALLNWACIK